MNQSERRTILIQVLLKEHPEYRGLRIPADADTQWQLLRGLLNIREPRRIGTDFLQIQDAYLQEEIAAKGITDAADLTPLQPGLYLWQGDITTLKCDAIVNAANSDMTGCYCPAVSTTPSTPMPGCSCVLPVQRSWTGRDTRNPPDRQSSRPHLICPAAMCCTRLAPSSMVG